MAERIAFLFGLYQQYSPDIAKEKTYETLEKTYKTAIDRETMKVKKPLAVFRIMFEDTDEIHCNSY